MKEKKIFKIKIDKESKLPDKNGMAKWEHIVKTETDYIIIFE